MPHIWVRMAVKHIAMHMPAFIDHIYIFGSNLSWFVGYSNVLGCHVDGCRCRRIIYTCHMTREGCLRKMVGSNSKGIGCHIDSFGGIN